MKRTKRTQELLSQEQLAVLTGDLLGDLSLRFPGENWGILSGTQKDKEWLFKQYKNYVRTSPQLDSLNRWYFNTLIN